MGIFNFWKHEAKVPSPEVTSIGKGHDLGLGKDNLGFEEPGTPSDTTGLGEIGKTGEGPDSKVGPPAPGMPPGGLEPVEETPVSQPSAFGKLEQTSDTAHLSKNIEIISSKVDTLKAILDNLTNKIEKIEKIAEGEEEKKEHTW